MIKYNSSSNVISQFNPILNLSPQIRIRVNNEFIKPILKHFFSNKEGIANYKELDVDRLKTEVEFINDTNYVKEYLYSEIMNEITKDADGNINYKPRYTISFDETLTDFKEDLKSYPYTRIFKHLTKSSLIKYGALRLGDAIALYVIHIELQKLIDFVKILPYTQPKVIKNKKNEDKGVTRRQSAINHLIAKQVDVITNSRGNDKKEARKELKKIIKHIPPEKLEGERGSLRVNLSWSTTDDLDLHIKSKHGIISYENDTLQYKQQKLIGKLDVDANAGKNIISNPQENIFWNLIPKGKHTISINFYSNRENIGKVPFTLFIENGNNSREFSSFVEAQGENKTREIATFEYKEGFLDIKLLLPKEDLITV